MSAFSELRAKLEEDVRWYGKKYKESKELLDQLKKVQPQESEDDAEH